MAHGHILLWSWKRSSKFEDLPPGFDEIFFHSLKLVKIAVAGSVSCCSEIVGMCEDRSCPGLLESHAPVLCRFEGNVARSAVRKVSLPDVYNKLSTVQLA